MTPEEVERLDNIVKQVGGLLGFKFDEEIAAQRENQWVYFAYLYNGTARLSFEYGGHKNSNRWTISGAFPSYKGERLGPYGKRFSISVNGEKSSERIAKDIKSRLLPDYLAAVNNAEVQLEETIKYHKERHESISKIANYLGLPEPEEGKEVVYPSYKSMEEMPGGRIYKIEACSENTVKFDVECSPNRAIRILEIIREE